MYFLPQESCIFPPIEEANADGILAIGGNLSVNNLLLAYQNGIFPWYNADDPITWWSPDPRFVIYPEYFKISKSTKQLMRSNKFHFKMNTCFEKVIEYCQHAKRQGQDGTWITDEMKEAYIKLHQQGLAHSVETYEGDELVGGFYGVAMGKVFSGESMFSLKSNGSKAALTYFIQKFCPHDYTLIDCQYFSKHLQSLGAENIPRKTFISILNEGLGG